MSKLMPQEEDFGVVYDYLPAEGHPQGVEEEKCPYCALRRIHSRIAEMEAASGLHDKSFRGYVKEVAYQIKRAEQAEAALAERDRMRAEGWKLVHRVENAGLVVSIATKTLFAARAEEGSRNA